MKENKICWVSSVQLAISSGETSIRVWNLKTDDNFVVNIENALGGEFITCLDYCQHKKILSAGRGKPNPSLRLRFKRVFRSP